MSPLIITQFRSLKLKGPKRAPEHPHFGVPLSCVEADWERGHGLLSPLQPASLSWSHDSGASVHSPLSQLSHSLGI